jgi:hypothetical protein
MMALMDRKKPDSLNYATPVPRREGSPEVPAPYIAFGVCGLLVVVGILLWGAGGATGSFVGLLIAIPAALGSIVLPIVMQMREKP